MEDGFESEYKPLTAEYLRNIRKNKETKKQKQTKAPKNGKGQQTPDNQGDEFVPDITLSDGEVLPQYYGKCPEKLLGQPLEDLDPYYKEKGEPTFCVATERFSSVYIYRFTAARACFILSPFNPIRRWAVQISVNQFFDYFVMLTIVVNCVFLALDNEIVESEYAFTAIYTLEMVIKLIARGVILRKFTYLRDGWNWLDFIVVILAWVTIIIAASSDGPSNLNLSGLRTFRVIRAFKSFTIVPGLKTIVNSLLQSLKPLAEVMVIMLFLVVVISLIALQAYQGVLKRKCVKLPLPYRTSPEQFNAYVQNSDNWNPVDGEQQVCGNSSSSGLCPDGYLCMQDVGNNPNNGFTNFDHFGWAMLTSFQLLTLDYWENVYNMIIRAEGAWNVLFFFMCVVLGPFYLLNLLLAVVTLAYSKEHEKQTKLREMRERAKENARRRNKRRRLLMERSRNKGQMPALEFSDVVDHKVNQAKDKNGNGLVIPNLANGNMSPRSARGSEVSSKKEGVRSQMPIISSNDNSRRHTASLRKDMSLDSSESANSTGSEWKRWIKKKYAAFHSTCCSWTCHPKFQSFQKILLKVVEHKLFEGFVVLSIVTNTVFLAADHHNIDATFENVLVIGNYVFTGIFCVEALLKIMAMGCLGYFKNPWNLFDFSIVVISLLEFAFRSSANESSSALSVLRSLRLMRVFRLARIWTTMRKLMSIILKSLSAVVYLTIVLFMVLFIFAVVGKQLYSGSYQNSADKFEDGQVPRWNFNDFYHSFLLVWRVMCGEWIEPLHDCMLIADSASCIPLFLLMTFIGNFLVLNLFTAILLEAFNVDNLKSKQVDQKTAKLKLGVERFKKLLKKSQNKEVKLEENVPANANDSSDCVSEIPVIEQADSELEVSIPDSAYKKKRSLSLANMFALNQVSGKRRSLGDSQDSVMPEDTGTVVENSPTISSSSAQSSSAVAAAGRLARRRTLTKQSRISDDDILSRENEMATTTDVNKKTDSPRFNREVNTAKSSSDTDDSDAPPTGSATKKVTFAVTGNSKVYPRPRTGTLQGSVENEVKTTRFSWCAKCCISCKRSEERKDVTAVVAIEERNLSPEVVDPKSSPQRNNSPPACFPRWCRCCYFLKDNDLWRKWTKFRTYVFRLVEHRIFEWFILFVILASTVSLALEDINLKNDPERERILGILEYVFTSIFTVEMVLKWMGIGFTKYFTNWWCIIDFVIVVISWIGIGATSGDGVDSLKALRTLRALRPLRAISRWQGMRVVVNALVYCIPSIANVLCVCMLLWLVFSIIGVQQFKGKFYRCEDANGDIINDTIVPNKTICLQENLNWTTPRINFDNVLNGMIALFQVATFEGWIEVMADASDTRMVDQQPSREANPYSYIFFFCFVLIGSFFILNLIVGVIIESFQTLRKQTESSSAVEAFLTESQKNFYKTMRTMLNRKPKKTIPPPENPAQLKIFNLVSHSKFEVAVFSVIVLNMVTLAMEHYKMSSTWSAVLRYVDIAFTAAFTLEAALKIFGTRFYYFRDPFNVFDFVVVLLSITGFILEELLTFLVSPTLLRVVRVFRVFRVLRVIRAARGIRRLILTLMISLPALFNIAVLLGVFMVIFAILGMSFFMEVKLRGALNDIVNFQTFGSSMMLLFRLMTSAGWNDVLDPLMNDSDCVGEECGKYHVAIIYFVAYIFLVFLVIVNMYIAIILENFDEIFQQEESGVGQDDFEFFYVVWGRYDPKASQFVSIAELSNLLHSLHPPFQLAKPNEIKIAALNLPIVNGDKVHCLDVLFALVKRIMGEVEISDQMRQEAEARLLKSFPNRKSLKAETTTLALRQRVKAAKTIQEAWRGFNGKRKRVHETSSMELFSQSSTELSITISKFSNPPFIEAEDNQKPPLSAETYAEITPDHKNMLDEEQLLTERVGVTRLVAKHSPDTEVHKHIFKKNLTRLDSISEIPVLTIEDESLRNNPNLPLHVYQHTDSRAKLPEQSNHETNDTVSEVDMVQVAFSGKAKTEGKLKHLATKHADCEEDASLIENDYIFEELSDSSQDRNVQPTQQEVETGLDTANLDSRARYSEQNSLNLTDKLFRVVLPRVSPNASPSEEHIMKRKREEAPSNIIESTPVRGKDLKFNPQTGKFKMKTKKTESSPALVSQPTKEQADNQIHKFEQSTVISNYAAEANNSTRSQSASHPDSR